LQAKKFNGYEEKILTILKQPVSATVVATYIYFAGRGPR